MFGIGEPRKLRLNESDDEKYAKCNLFSRALRGAQERADRISPHIPNLAKGYPLSSVVMASAGRERHCLPQQ